MCKLQYILFSIVVLLFDFLIPVCAKRYEYKSLGVEDGLSQITISTICQDNKSRIWIATLDGLNCYDGNRIRVFNHFHNDSISYGNLYVTRMVESKGSLYLLTSLGLFVFNLATEQYRLLPFSNPVAVAVGKQCLWIAGNDRLFRYNQDTRQIIEFKTNSSLPLLGSEMLEDTAGNLWVALADRGLMCIDVFGNVTEKLRSAKVMKMILGSGNHIWIGTQEQGVFCFSEKGDKLHSYKPRNDMARALCQDFEGNIWVGYRSGLSKINPSSGEIIHYEEKSDNVEMSGNTSVTSLYTDRQGIVWVGTYWGGVRFFSPEYQYVDFYKASGNELSYPVVGAMTEDSAGNIWICTEGGGLNLYSPQRKAFEHFNTKSGIRFSSNFLKDIAYDDFNGCLWIAADFSNKVNCFYPKTSTHAQKQMSIPLPEEAGAAVFALAGTKDKLFAGTTDAIVCLDKKTGQASVLYKEKELFTHNYNTLLIDSKGRLWFASKNGCTSYSISDKKFETYHINLKRPVCSFKELVNIFFEDKKGNIWVGTHGNGLFCLDEQIHTFSLYLNPVRLSGQSIRAINELPSGNLLIGTEHGLFVLDHTDKNLTHFNTNTGFPLTFINRKSLLVSSEGRIYIGGPTGMAVTQEQYLKYPHRLYNLYLTNLYVNNEEVHIGDKTGILSNSFAYTDKIKLSHFQNFFSIEFSTDSYLNSGDVEIQYRLKGYNEEWNENHTGNNITYTNISPGDYTFEIRLKEHPEILKKLDIRIEPPLYATWWAYTIYTLAVLVALYLIIREYNIRMYLKTKLDFELREKEHIEELNQSKLRFFTNISHEIRTPVTLILGQVELLLNSRNLSTHLYSKLLNIHKNAESLKQLLSELLDFRKQEQGQLKLKIHQFDLYNLLKEQYALFKELSVNRNITFSFESVAESCYIWGDRSQIQKVINNLLSNAFKYTEDGGTITVGLTEEAESCSFFVSDNGCGIAKEEIPNIFERFYQAGNVGQREGTGIGLALCQGIIKAHHGNITVKSNIGKGSVFTVTLMKGESHFDSSVLRIFREQAKEYIYDKEDKEALSNEMQLYGSDKEVAKLLIVDDNNEIIDILRDVLSPLYVVYTANDGEEGYNMIKDIQPDLVISDIMMPKMSGTELCTKVKNNIETCHIPVILLTALGAPEHELDGLRIGADLYVVKPFNIRKLVMQCNNLINTRRILQQKYARRPGIAVEKITTTALDQKFIEHAVKVVEDNLENSDFNVETFAKEMGCGRTLLFKKIKGITGSTPNSFIMNIRLKKAAYLLLDAPDMNITDIAYSLNFGNPQYFNKCFRELFGVSPSQYRKSQGSDS